MIFLILLIIVAAWALIFGFRPWRRVAAEPLSAEGAGILPKISIIAYALRNEHNLPGYLDSLLQQDYPDFEVILVCDASAEATAMLSEKFENIPNLHITFIPPGSHSLSRRKLAQTVGIKAASGEVVILTATSALPRSPLWLRYMAAPFADHETAAALGFIRQDPSEFVCFGKSYRIFDYLLSSIQWISAALDGKPFRSCGFNLAFRRKLFFDLKGYASSITLMDGDDDIFITGLAKYGACTPVLAPEAYLLTNWGYRADNLHSDLKDRWNFTCRFLPKAPFRLAGLTSATQWLTPLLTILTILPALAVINPAIFGAADPATNANNVANNSAGYLLDTITASPIFGFPGEAAAIAAIIIAAIILPAYWIAESILLKKCALKLKSRYKFLLTIPFLLCRPISNMIFTLSHHATRRAHLSKHN